MGASVPKVPIVILPVSCAYVHAGLGLVLPGAHGAGGPRGHTACVDACLTPKIKAYVARFLSGFDSGLGNVKVSFMQSDGGLTPAAAFTGFQAILSGM